MDSPAPSTPLPSSSPDDQPPRSSSSSTLNTTPRRRSRMRSIFPVPGSGMLRDLKARLPYYPSDWTHAWNYRVIPATAMIFFSNILPGIAFSLDLIETTNAYGVCEVLLSSFMAAFIFSIFGAQPLCIAGVTGPITVLNSTIYNILKTQSNPPDYLQFIGWVYFWGAIMHWIAALLNSVNFLRYVTRFSCETFGFFVACVYIQYGIQITTRQFLTSSPPASLTALILALLTLTLSHTLLLLSHTTLFTRLLRRFLSDYGMPLTLIAVSGMAYWGRFEEAGPERLPVPWGAFGAAGGRAWVVRFWELEAKWVGVALPFGFILFVLFYFDHNVSSLIAQSSDFPLRKPPGFHWDFFLLGITTFLAALLGVPAPNGLIPQAPIHTRSLLVMGYDNDKKDEERDEEKGEKALGGVKPGVERPVAVVEQRVSNLAQGALCLVFMAGPFLKLLGFVPRGVLAGLFWYMGTDALAGSDLTAKILYLLRDKDLIPPDESLLRVRKSRILLFLAIELAGFGATFAIVQTIAAIGFPIIIFLLVPVRIFIIPRLPFTPEELAILDGPTASPFTMESVGGSL